MVATRYEWSKRDMQDSSDSLLVSEPSSDPREVSLFNSLYDNSL